MKTSLQHLHVISWSFEELCNPIDYMLATTQ